MQQLPFPPQVPPLLRGLGSGTQHPMYVAFATLAPARAPMRGSRGGKTSLDKQANHTTTAETAIRRSENIAGHPVSIWAGLHQPVPPLPRRTAEWQMLLLSAVVCWCSLRLQGQCC
mmetsp:Transcript_117227/g.233594  ORF Transcript_117227/g.233594 Transcript_117227/m.233594 type:complete len:116 (+) Transcript_117227:341-688(+)